MDKLTTERLHQYQKSFDARDDHQGDFRVDDVRAMVRELLSLRTDAGDEEVLYLRAVVCNGIWSKDKRDHEEADKAIDRIVSKAVSLRNELRSAREEIAALTAERDEARKEVEQLRMAVGCATTIKGDMVMRADDPIGMMQEVCSYVATLRSCPEMGEVDAIEDWLEGKEIEFGVVRRIKRLVEMVGRLSAALTEERKRGDEVAGLLRWWVEFKDGFGQLEGISVGSAVNEWKENAAKILAICGKGVGT